VKGKGSLYFKKPSYVIAFKKACQKKDAKFKVVAAIRNGCGDKLTIHESLEKAAQICLNYCFQIFLPPHLFLLNFYRVTCL